MKKLIVSTVVFALLFGATSALVSAQDPALSPGLYVTDLRITPDPPTNDAALTFYATFNNTAGGDQNLRWLVYIYRTSNMRVSLGETASSLTTFPAGTSEMQALGYWKLGPGSPCDNFVARVGVLDGINPPLLLTQSDGKLFEKKFTVCPPADDSVVRAPGAGLFVTDLRVSPDPPTNNAALTFYPTFQNTDNQTLSFTWLVYVYWASVPKYSYGETSALTTDFPVGKGEYPSLGYWKMGPGYPCTQFLARVGWLDIDHNTQFFTTPDGKVFEKGFTVCAP